MICHTLHSTLTGLCQKSQNVLTDLCQLITFRQQSHSTSIYLCENPHDSRPTLIDWCQNSHVPTVDISCEKSHGTLIDWRHNLHGRRLVCVTVNTTVGWSVSQFTRQYAGLCHNSHGSTLGCVTIHTAVRWAVTIHTAVS